MATYSLADLIDKTLYAKKAVVKLFGDPSKPTSKETIGAGGLIGKLYSWVWGGANKNILYLMFYNTKVGTPNYNKPYYVVANGNALDEKYVQHQGVKSIEQKEKEALEAAKKKQNGAIAYYIEKWGTTVLTVGVAAYVVVEGVKYYNSRANKNGI